VVASSEITVTTTASAATGYDLAQR
jgi:hypothetical protein